MSELYVTEREVAVPGQLLATGMDYIPGTGAYRKDESVIANRVGLVSITGRAIKLTPLSGPYRPKRDDILVCKITDITMNGWRIQVNNYLNAMLNLRDATNSFVQKSANLSKIIAIGDHIVCKITQVSTQKLIDVTMKAPGLKKLVGGQIIKYNSNKFARIIGRQGSMVSMIKRASGCQITVGQNGYIWIYGEPDKEVIVSKALQLIEQKAHISGLTDQVKAFLQSQGLTVSDPEPQQQSEQFENHRSQNWQDNENSSNEGGFAARYGHRDTNTDSTESDENQEEFSQNFSQSESTDSTEEKAEEFKSEESK